MTQTSLAQSILNESKAPAGAQGQGTMKILQNYFSGSKYAWAPYLLLALSMSALFIAARGNNSSNFSSVQTFLFAMIGFGGGLSMSPLRMKTDTIRSSDSKATEANVRGAFGLSVLGLLPLSLKAMQYYRNGQVPVFKNRVFFILIGSLVGYLVGHVTNSIRYETLGSSYQPLKIHFGWEIGLLVCAIATAIFSMSFTSTKIF